MKTYIALLRGVNLVGRNRLPMKDLKLVLEQCGCVDVHTFVQSGNAIIRSGVDDTSGLEKRVAAAVFQRHGFEPRVLVLPRSALARAAAANPFPEAADNPTSVHLFFLAARPRKPDLAGMDAIKAKSERYALKGKVFYLHTPDGFGTSRLASRAERLLGVDATARNWRTVTTVLQMASLAPGGLSRDRR
jgi:uncharacterized protein (DUF1697 family)